MIGHRVWASSLLGQQAQKTFRIAEGKDVLEITLTFYPDQKKAPEGSSAEPEGFGVSVAYKAAPDTFLFQRTFPTEREARGAFDDLSKVAGEVEGLIRQEKMDEAVKATEAFKDKMKSNSSETPILPSGRA